MTAIGPPIYVELCLVTRELRPCLGRIHRSGQPEVSVCLACGSRSSGAIYRYDGDATTRLQAGGYQ